MRTRLVWLTPAIVVAAFARPQISFANACGGGTSPCGSTTSVTYSGQALTYYGAATNGTVRSEIWYLKAPPSGAHDVIVNTGSANVATATSASFTGVDQTTPLGSLVSAIGTGTAASVTAASAVGQAVVDVLGAVGSNAPSVGSSQTRRDTNNTSSGASHVLIGSSTAPGAASTTMSWTLTSADWALAAVPVRPSSAQTGVAVESFTATREPNHVRLDWQTGYEPTSLGFTVFREGDAEAWAPLNGSLIQGDAIVGPVSSFSWTDDAPGWQSAHSYWLKDEKLDGTFSWYGPATLQGSAAEGGASELGTSYSPVENPSGCGFVARTPLGEAIELALLLALVMMFRNSVHRRSRAAMAILIAGVLVANLSLTPPASASGGVGYDATATGTGTSGLSFSHTMGAGSNGLLVVGVVVPVTCEALQTDNNNCGSCGNACGGQTCMSGTCSCAGGTPNGCGAGLTATFYDPWGITADNAGDLFVANGLDNAVRQVVLASGVVTTLGISIESYVNSVSADHSGSLYFSDGNSVRKLVVATSAATTIAGVAGSSGTAADGTGTNAVFAALYDITLDSAGSNLYVTDGASVRKVTTAGVVTTIAGVAGASGYVDGTGSNALFSSPTGIATDSAGNLFVIDTNTLRKVVIATGVVSTIAGIVGVAGTADGTGTNALFWSPSGIAIDSAGTNLFIADGGVIRKVAKATSVVTTLAGIAGQLFSQDDGTGTSATFGLLSDVTADNNGNLFVTDSNLIRQVVEATGAVTTVAGSATQYGGNDSSGPFCVDEQSNSNNCGACDHVCPSWETCQGASCSVSCGGGSCTEAQDCTSYNGSEQACLPVDNCSLTLCCASAAQACQTSSNSGQTVSYCDDAATGCSTYTDGDTVPSCIDTNSDPQNCGACNFACTSGQTCIGGGCLPVPSCGGGANDCAELGAVPVMKTRLTNVDAPTYDPWLVADRAGNIYEPNNGDVFRRAANGTMSNFVTGFQSTSGGALDDAGTLYVADVDANEIYTVTTSNGTATPFVSVGAPTTLALDNAGNLFTADGNGIDKIVVATKAISNFLTTGIGFDSGGMTADNAGNLYVLDSFGGTITKYVIGTSASSVVASGFSYCSGGGIVTDNAGNLFVGASDCSVGVVDKYTISSGAVSTIATGFSFSYGSGLAIDNAGHLLVLDNNLTGVGSAALWQLSFSCTTVNLNSDINNCGACGNRCILGETCVSGTCVP